MKQKIIAFLGEEQAARVEKKATLRGITDIWDAAIERAKLEYPTATEEEQAQIAAVRACQRAGVIRRCANTVESREPIVESQAEAPAPANAPEVLPDGPAARAKKPKAEK